MKAASFSYEELYWSQGLRLVCGVDEVGRGCFAGPVAAGAVIFHPDIKLPIGLKDSKQLDPKSREAFAEVVKSVAVAWSVSFVDVPMIDGMGIANAVKLAFQNAIKTLGIDPDFVLVDAFSVPGIPMNKQLPIIKGDQLSATIAAASIIAKVERDKLMSELDLKYPGYGFAKHKGYGTKDHRQAIGQLGLCQLHRQSFDLRKFLNVA